MWTHFWSSPQGYISSSPHPLTHHPIIYPYPLPNGCAILAQVPFVFPPTSLGDLGLVWVSLAYACAFGDCAISCRRIA